MGPWIGSLFSGAGLAWGIYSFVIKRQDKQRDMEARQAQVFQDIRDKEVYNKIEELKRLVGEQDKSFNNLRIVVASLMQQVKAQGQQFNDTTLRIEKVLDRHESKLDSFGKVVVK